ncbi:hypothetical protein, partial [Acidiphilium sp. PM]|uniref:hypothetical protein n=1 Tax=Acidiphilium sp. PM TaxID=1043206 RepID=UPI000588013A
LYGVVSTQHYIILERHRLAILDIFSLNLAASMAAIFIDGSWSHMGKAVVPETDLTGGRRQHRMR